MAATTPKTTAKDSKDVRRNWVRKLQRMFCHMKGFSAPAKLQLTRAADTSKGKRGREAITDDAARAASAAAERTRISEKSRRYRARKKAKMESGGVS